MLLKKILAIFIIFFGLFSIWIKNTTAGPVGQWDEEQTWNVYDIFNSWLDWLTRWIKKVKDTIPIIEKDKPFSEYIQSLVVWILSFLSLIALIYIIWAWLNIMISWWDDDKMKNQKKTIISVIIWIVVIWLAYSMVITIFKWLNLEDTTSPTWTEHLQNGN